MTRHNGYGCQIEADRPAGEGDGRRERRRGREI